MKPKQKRPPGNLCVTRLRLVCKIGLELAILAFMAWGCPVSAQAQSGAIVDPTFVPPEYDWPIDPSLRGSVKDMILQPDGKVLLIIQPPLQLPNHLVRLNPTGSIDSSFLTDVVPASSAAPGFPSMALQEDGHIVLWTVISPYPWETTFKRRLVWLKTNGSVDLHFLPDLMFSDGGDYPLVLQKADGRLVVSSVVEFIPGKRELTFELVELTTEGKWGNYRVGIHGYLGGFGTALPLSAIAMKPDGSIILSGHYDRINETVRSGDFPNKNVDRVSPSGALDQDFHGSFEEAGASLVQPDGKIVFGTQRRNPDGIRDEAFNKRAALANEWFGNLAPIALLPDGKILYSTPRGLVRLRSNGDFDAFWNTGDADISSAIVQPDGRILVAGWFREINGIKRISIARLIATPPPFKPLPRLKIAGRSSVGVVSLGFSALREEKFVVEATTNFLSWIPFFTNTSSGLILGFKDQEATGFRLHDTVQTVIPHRFYRARLADR